MIQKNDIKTREDILLLVNTFYYAVLQDKIISKYFKGVFPFSLDTHIPIMVNFWESVLFGTGGYQGNVIQKHIHLHEKLALDQTHFDQWMYLWKENIHKLFEGKKAEEAITKASTMSALMLFKIEKSSQPGFIQ